MTITPHELLDTSIGQLQTLVAFLDGSNELGRNRPHGKRAPVKRSLSRYCY